MGAITNGITGGTASTTDGTSFVSGSFTPAAGDFMVVYVGASGTVASAPTLTASANGMTFKLLGSATKNTSADTLYAFISLQRVPASPASMTVTFTCTQDAATGAIISVARASGMSRTGEPAIRQTASVNNVAGGTAPSVTFGKACLTGNMTLFGFLVTVTTGTTTVTGMTEQVDANYSTPTTGSGYDSRNSGFTGTVLTLGSTANGACCAFAIELDTSDAEGWGVAL